MKTIFDLDQIKGNSQRDKYPQTIGEKLYWSLANVVMVSEAHKKKASVYDYGVRTNTYQDNMDGIERLLTDASKNLLEDEKLKMKLPRVCYYCGEDDLSILETDHMIPKIKRGGDYSENLVPACQHCNRSKGGKDMLEWMKLNEMNPSVLVLRRYLKLAILYCKKNDLIDYPAVDYKTLDLPFAFELIPIRLPYLGATFKYFVIDL